VRNRSHFRLIVLTKDLPSTWNKLPRVVANPGGRDFVCCFPRTWSNRFQATREIDSRIFILKSWTRHDEQDCTFIHGGRTRMVKVREKFGLWSQDAVIFYSWTMPKSAKKRKAKAADFTVLSNSSGFYRITHKRVRKQNSSLGKANKPLETR
jgi:hypothetical protein